MKRILVTMALVAVAGAMGACSKHQTSTSAPPPPSAAAPASSTMKMMPTKPMTAHPAMTSSTTETRMAPAATTPAPETSTSGG